jgi:hypothetical protein
MVRDVNKQQMLVLRAVAVAQEYPQGSHHIDQQIQHSALREVTMQIQAAQQTAAGVAVQSVLRMFLRYSTIRHGVRVFDGVSQ